jgi:hypothetical protein
MRELLSLKNFHAIFLLKAYFHVKENCRGFYKPHNCLITSNINVMGRYTSFSIVLYIEKFILMIVYLLFGQNMKDSEKLALITAIGSVFLGPAGPIVFWTGMVGSAILSMMEEENSEEEKCEDCS